ncbi:MAG: cyclophilin-like fold protein [Dehalococcoidia bacterium]|nr:cyclophilin-like fold protein [Dehalococcoidia bacterium]
MDKISITIENLTVLAELTESPTAQRIWEALPLEGKANVWGEEIYFIIPIKTELEREARAEVEVGDLGYWPSGPAFCIFFGATPISTSHKPRAYSPVNVFGRILGDLTPLKTVTENARISVKRKGES